MFYIDNRNSHDPAINLALEEYLLKSPQIMDDLLMLYINEPSIIIGCHQNALEEINPEFVEQHQIHVVRRLSGGGTVYHDLGNLNFSFITKYQPNYFTNFQLFTEPVVRCLIKLGTKAELSSRSDILIEGGKVSGNAQYITHGRMVSHGTLLFNSDLSQVNEALRVDDRKIESKGIKSVRSRVVNICNYLPTSMSIEDFRTALLATYFENQSEVACYPLQNEDWQAIDALAETRYRQWDWNYGHSPAFTREKYFHAVEGEIGARLFIEKGLIQSVMFFSNDIDLGDITTLEKYLIGVRYQPQAIKNALQNFPLDAILPKLTLQKFIEFIY